jgi:heme exporter protein C
MLIAWEGCNQLQDAMTLIDLANPTKFLALNARLLPWLAGRLQSRSRSASICRLSRPLAEVAAKAAAPIGAAFTFLALVTGSLWGRPMWGTYWEWDARLTSMLILFLMYLGLIELWRSVEDPTRAARAAAVLTLVGAVNLPIIKFSVDWWNTLHQPASVLRTGGPSLDRAFLVPLLVMGVAFILLFSVLHLAAMRNEILRRRVRSLQMTQARTFSRPADAGSRPENVSKSRIGTA